MIANTIPGRDYLDRGRLIERRWRIPLRNGEGREQDTISHQYGYAKIDGYQQFQQLG